MKIIILGAGLVGGPMALDLANDPAFEVTIADISKDALENLLERQKKLNERMRNRETDRSRGTNETGKTGELTDPGTTRERYINTKSLPLPAVSILFS